MGGVVFGNLQQFLYSLVGRMILIPSRVCWLINNNCVCIACGCNGYYLSYIVSVFIYEMNMCMTITVNRNLHNCESSPKKSFSGLQQDSNSWPLHSCCSALPAELWRPIHWRQANFFGLFSKLLKLWSSHIHFICIPAVHIILFSIDLIIFWLMTNNIISVQSRLRLCVIDAVNYILTQNEIIVVSYWRKSTYKVAGIRQ